MAALYAQQNFMQTDLLSLLDQNYIFLGEKIATSEIPSVIAMTGSRYLNKLKAI